MLLDGPLPSRLICLEALALKVSNVGLGALPPQTWVEALALKVSTVGLGGIPTTNLGGSIH